MKKTLNKEQKEAVQYIKNPLLVLAGAGSGKTSVITAKISYLLYNNINPKNIFAVTFTNKSANEMKDRIKKIFKFSTNNFNVKDLNISTFHTLGLHILKEEIKAINYKPSFTLFDEQDSFNLIKEIAYNIYKINKSDKEILYKIKNKISSWKNSLFLPNDINEKEKSNHLKEFIIYEEYQKLLKSYNSLDFDDLILLPVKIWNEFSIIKHKWQSKCHYLLIDEYQDTNKNQYEFIKILVEKRKKFTVVGDDDQSIYAWRGAEPENLTFLQKDFPDLKVIKLEQNYRSTNSILNTANKLISYNNHLFEKKLWSNNNDGEKVKIIEVANDNEEIKKVVRNISIHKLLENTNYKDYAILYRSNFQAFNLEKEFQINNIPYKIQGGMSFFARQEIKDILSYFKLIINNDDDSSFLRVINIPKRGIGHSTLSKLGEYTKKRNISLFKSCTELGLKNNIGNKQAIILEQFSNFIIKTKKDFFINNNYQDLKGILENFISAIGYKEYLTNLSLNKNQAVKKNNNIEEFLNFILNIKSDENESFINIVQNITLIDILSSNKNNKEKNEDKVNLMTIHSSKGLEFKYVYLIGFEEDILPHKQSVEDNLISEERRLCYVAITRAQKELSIIYTKERKKFGKFEKTIQSRFLNEFDDKYLNFVNREIKDKQEIKKIGNKNLMKLKNKFNCKTQS